MKRSVLKILLVKHEGLKLSAYTDTVGKVTIGVGRNLVDVGVSEQEAMELLDHDIDRIWRALTSQLAFFGSLDDTRQHVLISMAFNIGVAGMLHFSKMLDALEHLDFERAAREMEDSKWYQQTGARGKELAAMMRS